MEDPSRQFATFFTNVCVEISQRKEASPGKIADLIGLKETRSVVRFETGETFPTANLDAFAAAYAALEGIDPRDLFTRAVTYWQRFGNPPLIAEERKRATAAAAPYSAEAMIEEIRKAEQAERHAQPRATGAAQPSAIHRRRAGGG